MNQYIYLTSKLTSRSIRRPVAIKDVYHKDRNPKHPGSSTCWSQSEVVSVRLTLSP
jgi:hypothetical protein